jgi:RNA polymerase sigma-70 factor (ECF subfamily)
VRSELIRASDLLRLNTPEAVAEAVGLLQNTVYSFSMKMCGHREDAEDTMQEVLFRSMKYLPKLQDPSALAAWLYTVTRNRCRRLRGAADALQSHRLSLDELMPDEDELRELLLDKTNSPEGKLLVEEERQLLHRAVLEIPPPLRMVLVLSDMEELSTGQVAQILDLREGTVRVRLHRARLALRKQMMLMLKHRTETGAIHESESASPKVLGYRQRRIRTKRPKECRELFAGLSEYLDGGMKPETCDKISAHMERCPACVIFLRELRTAIDRCRSLEVSCDPTVASRLKARLTQEYLRMLGNAGPTDSASPA